MLTKDVAATQIELLQHVRQIRMVLKVTDTDRHYEAEGE